MSEKDVFDLSRRKVLAGLGTIGAASAGIGLGTSAYFSDEENFVNNSLVAGELDMKMAYSAHYSDWKPNAEGVPEDKDVNVSMWDGAPDTTGESANLTEGYTGLPTNDSWLIEVDDPGQFLNNTQYASAGNASCEGGTDSGDLEQPVINIEDVKPGDFGEVTFDFALCDNPGYVWLQGELLSCAENGVTEPEAEDEDENEEEPRTPEPDGASVLPLLAAGAVPSASSLFDGGVREKLSGGVERAVESDAVTRKDVLKAATTGAAGVAAAGAMSGTAAAAVGDELGEVTLPDHESDADPFFCGVGGAFDGTHYVVPKEGDGDCASDVIQIYDPPSDGDSSATLVSEKNIVDTNGNSVTISTNAWDQTRNQHWATGGGPVYLLDLGDRTDGSVDAVAEEMFSAESEFIVDGLAYDGINDALYYSGDVSEEVLHYDIASGSETARSPVVPKDDEGNVLGEISGVATGAIKDGEETLYVGQNPGPDDGNIFRVSAEDGGFIDTFETGTGFRVEEISCDTITYESEAILVKDARGSRYKAFQVPEGTCPIGGGGGGDDDDGGECADVELLDAVQAAAWVDDGDNYQDGEEEPVVSGSLRDVLGELSDGTGLGLAGDTPAEEGGGMAGSRDCFSAETEHSVAFAWWVPVDHGNEIQTDSASFELSFYTEQCRHNDGSGMTTETTTTEPGGG